MCSRPGRKACKAVVNLMAGSISKEANPFLRYPSRPMTLLRYFCRNHLPRCTHTLQHWLQRSQGAVLKFHKDGSSEGRSVERTSFHSLQIASNNLRLPLFRLSNTKRLHPALQPACSAHCLKHALRQFNCLSNKHLDILSLVKLLAAVFSLQPSKQTNTALLCSCWDMLYAALHCAAICRLRLCTKTRLTELSCH